MSITTRITSVRVLGEVLARRTVVFRVQGTSATPVHEVSFADLRQTQNLDRDAAEKLLLNGKQPTGRLVAPEAVATLIELLCAPESRDLTGAAIPIDGGWSAM